MLRITLRVTLAATMVATMVIAAPPHPTQAAARPVDLPAEAAVSIQQAVAETMAAVIRIVHGNTSWGLGAQYCGNGNAYQNGGVTVRAPNGVVRKPARIWPGDTATITCAGSARPVAPTGGSGWVAPLTGGLLVRGDCKVGGEGGHYLARRNGHLHQGVDFGRPRGTAIMAIRAGVVSINKGQTNRYGRLVRAGWYIAVYHGGGVTSVAMHLSARSTLRVGTRVRAGQVIGYVGSTGTSSGPHLHFEIRIGRVLWSASTNPSRFLRQHGVPVRGC